MALHCLNHIQETKVTVSAHRTLNTVRGVISEDDLMDCPVEEILEGMHGQAVIAAKRIIILRDGKEIPTKHIILTLELNSILSSVKAGYLNCRVRPYVPNRIRCFRCQRFGHGSWLGDVRNVGATSIPLMIATKIQGVSTVKRITRRIPDLAIISRKKKKF